MAGVCHYNERSFSQSSGKTHLKGATLSNGVGRRLQIGGRQLPKTNSLQGARRYEARYHTPSNCNIARAPINGVVHTGFPGPGRP